MCVVVMVLVMHHDYRLSWKQMKDEDGAIERVGNATGEQQAKSR